MVLADTFGLVDLGRQALAKQSAGRTIVGPVEGVETLPAQHE